MRRRSSAGARTLPRRRAPERVVPPLDLGPLDAPTHWGSTIGWLAAGAVLVAAVLYLTWSVVGTLFAASVFAWLLHPPTAALVRRGWSRERATLFVLGGVIVLLLLAVGIIVPTVVSQIADLTVNIKPYIEKLTTQLAPALSRVERRTGLHVPADLEGIAEQAPTFLQAISPDMRERAQEWLQTLAKGGVHVVLGLFEALLLPLFTFYLLRDWPGIVGGVEALLPYKLRPTVQILAGRIDERLQGFVRGQLTVAFAIGCLYSTGLLVAGVELALMIGFLGGCLFLVPYLGAVVTASLAVTMAVLEYGLDWHVFAALATFGLTHLLEGMVITPALVGERVGLHPLVVMVALIVGGNLLGIAGIVLAVPATATAAVLLDWVLERWRASKTYGAPS